MNEKNFFASLILILSFISSVNSQVLPPDFLCVTNDTLVWSPVINTCGPFNAYVVYGSPTPEGPYTELANITDPTATNFYHADANNQTWYYYLASDHNCPGEEVIFSDTLDNLIPLANPLNYVTITGGGVEIDWDPSPSPETFAYIISRNTISGTSVLDTIFGDTNYFDTTGDPDLASETYFVVALDPCGNKSLVVDPHQTIFLEAEPPDPCNPIVNLSWNPYQNWTGGVDRYEIFASVNGGPFQLAGTTNGNTTTFSAEVNDQTTICYYVEAVEGGGSTFRSRSNETCTQVDILQPIRVIYLLGASVNADGSVTYQWLWDPTALLVEANEESFRDNDDVILVSPISVTPPLAISNTNTSTGVNANLAGHTFWVSATDECNNMVQSNPSPTIFLQGQAPGDGTNLLNWNALDHELATEVVFELIKVSGGTETTLFTGGAADLSFLDDIDLSSAEASGVCYYVQASVVFELPDGQRIDQVITSNIVCLEQAAKIFVPNVFAPKGVNSTFKPQLAFGMPQDYLLEIYDRWGGQVFQSRDITLGWNGQRNGEVMPQGVYLYRIQLTQSNGQSIDVSGDVMLLR